MHPIPLLFVDTSPTPTRGGAQRSLLFILESLDKEKFAPHVAMFVPHGIEDELRLLDIPYWIHDSSIPFQHQQTSGSSLPDPSDYHGTWRDLAYRVKALFIAERKRFFFVRLIAKNIKAQLIYLNGNYTAAHGALFAAKSLHVPVIAHQRRLSVYTLLDRLLSRWYDLMIMYSKKYSDYVERLGVRPRYKTVIYNAIHLDQLPQLSSEQSKSLKTELQLSEDIPILAQIGTIHSIKGQELTLQALHKIWNSNAPFYLLLIGEERDRIYVDFIKQLLEGTPFHSYVRFLGNRNDALSILSMCDISLEATKAEAGFSRVVIESLCMGKTVIAPKAGCKEIIQDGFNGYLYEDHDPASYANTIQRALLQPNDTIQHNANQTAKALFDGHSVASQLEEAIEWTLANHGRNQPGTCTSTIKIKSRYNADQFMDIEGKI